jgi:type IV pilus assembly protein PilA
MSQYMEKRNEKGFTLIELLIAIVVVGILAAVAIVGIAGLTGTSQKSACKASSDAATASSAAYYANSVNAAPARTPSWPANFTQLANTTDGVWTPVVGSDITTNVKQMNVNGGSTGGGWTLTFIGDGSAAPGFTCAP